MLEDEGDGVTGAAAEHRGAQLRSGQTESPWRRSGGMRRDSCGVGWLASDADELVKPTAHKIAVKYRAGWCAVSFSHQSVILSEISHGAQRCCKGTARGVHRAAAFGGQRGPGQGGDPHLGQPGAALE